MSLNNFYIRINKLSDEIIRLCEQENYEAANKLLNERLTLLKTLAAKALLLNDKSLAVKEYYQYLTQLKINDDQQKLKLIKARNITIQKNSKQQKTNKAINIYKQFK